MYPRGNDGFPSSSKITPGKHTPDISSGLSEPGQEVISPHILFQSNYHAMKMLSETQTNV